MLIPKMLPLAYNCTGNPIQSTGTKIQEHTVKTVSKQIFSYSKIKLSLSTLELHQ